VLNIAFLGSGGDFYLLPLKFLLASEFNLCLVGVDGLSKTANTDPRLQIFQANNIESLARQQNIPLIDFSQNLIKLCTQLESYQLDLLIVACYPHKLPEKILSIPKIAAVNLHPSLLPAYQGPVPLFWQFQHGQKEFGISLHKMDNNFDTGPIISQLDISFDDGISQQQANSILAEHAIQLLSDYFQAINNNRIVERKQQTKLSTYMSYPKDSDFEINPSWSAQHIFNFMHATKHWGKTYPCRLNNKVFLLKEAIEYSPHLDSEFVNSGLTYKIQKDIMSLVCNKGILKVRLFNPIDSIIPS